MVKFRAFFSAYFPVLPIFQIHEWGCDRVFCCFCCSQRNIIFKLKFQECYKRAFSSPSNDTIPELFSIRGSIRPYRSCLTGQVWFRFWIFSIAFNLCFSRCLLTDLGLRNKRECCLCNIFHFCFSLIIAAEILQPSCGFFNYHIAVLKLFILGFSA